MPIERASLCRDADGSAAVTALPGARAKKDSLPHAYTREMLWIGVPRSFRRPNPPSIGSYAVHKSNLISEEVGSDRLVRTCRGKLLSYLGVRDTAFAFRRVHVSLGNSPNRSR